MLLLSAALAAPMTPAQAEWEAALRADAGKLSQAPSDMIAHLPFDETSGNEPADLAATDRGGKIVGDSKWTQGKRDGALEFYGKTHVDLGDVADFGRADRFSCGAWIRPTSESRTSPTP